MVCKAKTFNAAQGGYEAPRCKVYNVASEGYIMGGTTPNSSDNGYDPDNDLGEI